MSETSTFQSFNIARPNRIGIAVLVHQIQYTVQRYSISKLPEIQIALSTVANDAFRAHPHPDGFRYLSYPPSPLLNLHTKNTIFLRHDAHNISGGGRGAGNENPARRTKPKTLEGSTLPHDCPSVTFPVGFWASPESDVDARRPGFVVLTFTDGVRAGFCAWWLAPASWLCRLRM